MTYREEYFKNKEQDLLARLKNNELTVEDILKHADELEILSLVSLFMRDYAGLLKRSPKRLKEKIEYQKRNNLEGIPAWTDQELITSVRRMIKEDAKWDGPYFVGSKKEEVVN